jgi:hypothetical protein
VSDCLLTAVGAVVATLASSHGVHLEVVRRVDGNSFFDLQTALRQRHLEGVAFHADSGAVVRCAAVGVPIVLKLSEPHGYHAVAVLGVRGNRWRVHDSRTGEGERNPAELLPAWKATGYQAFLVAKADADPSKVWKGCVKDVKAALRESYVYQAEELEEAAKAFPASDERHGKLLARAAEMRRNAEGDGHSFSKVSW